VPPYPAAAFTLQAIDGVEKSLDAGTDGFVVTREMRVASA
jgi:hypothetical protein